ncbi:uncharacterized protein FIBRA_03267 [Fibroporia radiculosa]|uniref:C2H2-type domain-containing protein n=1 Tax=Fibroporia radiculosa TaxID=599839 RepID=J4H2B2_9APHY|nr:uncharacterized protein FIBRA_03267 [Fibroporia radiculosa]CCM01219.1 predicted protein [Fibroporia radiculosa]
MTDVLYASMLYCSLCDRYFPGEEARAQHVQVSSNHPLCEPCNRRFANKNTLRNHLVTSLRHHYCAVCEREFNTAAGLRVHIDFASVHRDDSDDDDLEDYAPGDDEEFEHESGWEDTMGSMIYPEESERADDDLDVSEYETEVSDDGYDEEDEYWDEDFLDDVEDTNYDGFASIAAASSSVMRGRLDDRVSTLRLNIILED